MKLTNVYLSAGIIALCMAPLSNTHAATVACDDPSFSSELQEIFETNSCNICEISEEEVTTTYEDGTHVAEISNLEIKWKNNLEPSAEICVDLDEKSEEEQQECIPNQLIYESEGIDPEIISNYIAGIDPENTEDFWYVNEDNDGILWLPYEDQNEFSLASDDGEVVYKKSVDRGSIGITSTTPQDLDYLVVKQPILYRDYSKDYLQISDETKTYNTCLGIAINKGEEPEGEEPEVEEEEVVVDESSEDEDDLLDGLLDELLDEEETADENVSEEEPEVETQDVSEEEPEVDLNAAGPAEITSDQTDVDAGAEHMFLILFALIVAGVYIKRKKVA